MTIQKFDCKDNTISFLGTCKDCGWPVIDACCNDGFTDNLEGGEYADWWAYCTNKGCTNHKGEEYGQNSKIYKWCNK